MNCEGIQFGSFDAISVGQAFFIDSRANAEQTNIISSIEIVFVGGYNNPGDGGEGLYSRVLVEPSHPGKFQDNLGAWFELKANTSNPYQFGAIGDGVTDDTQALKDQIEYIKSQSNYPSAIVGPGDFYITDTLMYDVQQLTVSFTGRFIANISGKAAIIIGSPNDIIFSVKASGLYIMRTSIDLQANGNTTNSIGVHLLNICLSNIDIKYIANFATNVLCDGTVTGGAFSYNKVTFDGIRDAVVNMRLTASAAGYCNQNSFFCGSFGHSTSFVNISPTKETWNLIVDHFATRILNNNVFYQPSFEDNNSATYAHAAVINGIANVIFYARMENPDDQVNYKMELAANSSNCSIVGKAQSIFSNNILDNGLNNFWESYNAVYTESSVDTAGNGLGLHNLQSSSTSADKLIRCLDTGGIERAYIDGQGIISCTQRVFAENGLRMNTVDGTRNDFGIYWNDSSPEGVIAAQPGSICLVRASPSSMYRKNTGTGDTGWVLV